MYMEPWPGAWLKVPMLNRIFGTSVPCRCHSYIGSDSDDGWSSEHSSIKDICKQLNVSEFGLSDDEPEWV